MSDEVPANPPAEVEAEDEGQAAEPAEVEAEAEPAAAEPEGEAEAAEPEEEKKEEDDGESGSGSESSEEEKSDSDMAAKNRRSDRGKTHLSERMKRQKDILKNLQENANDREGTRGPKKKDFTMCGAILRGDKASFKSKEDLAKRAEEMEENIPVVDKQSKSLLAPVCGSVVPFHFACLKAATAAEEANGNSILKIAFNTPGVASTGQYAAAMRYPSGVFVKELAYRLKTKRVKPLQAQIAAGIKWVKEQEKGAKEAQNTTDSSKMTLQRAPQGQVKSLKEISCRPFKRSTGLLEAHANGVQYRPSSGETLNVFYSNVKRAFFIPADRSHLTIIHFHLEKAMLIGKKKVQDIQFYAEAYNDLDKTNSMGARRNQEEYELQMEEQERALAKKINTNFFRWCKSVEEAYGETLGMKFERPRRAAPTDGQPGGPLEIAGTPNLVRTNVMIRPTESCMVAVLETPFWVMCKEDVELCVCERAIMGARNFDLIIIYKDYTRPVSRVDAIPYSQLDAVQDLLNDFGIKYYDTRAPLQWTSIMERVRKDDRTKSWAPWDEVNGWPAMLDVDLQMSDDEAGTEDDDDSDSSYSPEGSTDEDEDDDFESDTGSSSASSSESSDSDSSDSSDSEPKRKRQKRS